MSHFSLLVVTDNPEELNSVLQPYHEYECTGVIDEYVVWVDETDEKFSEFNNPENTAPMIFDKDGASFSKYSDQAKKFYTKSDDSSFFGRDKFELTEGFTLKEVPFTEIYPNLSEYLRDWESYDDDNFKGNKVGRYTNPNSKWDWWQIGGRWSGYLKPKNAATGIKGSSGLMGTEYDSKGVDQCIKSNIDFNGRMKDAESKAEIEYDKVSSVIDNRDWMTFTECRKLSETNNENMDWARAKYRDQEVIVDLKKLYDSPFADLCQFKVSRDDFIKAKSNSSISTFAVLMDGKWYERGEMGWFGCVSDEKDKSDWSKEFKDLLDLIPDDACLTVVDCHI